MEFLLPPYGYLLPMVWLAYVTVTGMTGNRVPTAVTAVTCSVSVVVNVLFFGAAAAAIAFVVALAVFLTFALTAVVSRSTTVTVMPVLVALPVTGWVALIPGAAISAVVSYVRLRKKVEDGYFTMLAHETMASLGNRGGAIGKPDLSRLMRASDGSPHEDVKVRLSLFLLAGVAATTLLSLMV